MTSDQNERDDVESNGVIYKEIRAGIYPITWIVGGEKKAAACANVWCGNWNEVAEAWAHD